MSGMTASTSVGHLPARLARDLGGVFRKPLTLVATLVYLATAASFVVLFQRELKIATAVPPPPPASEQERFTQAWEQQPRVDLGIPPGTAKVVVVKFNDWLCPMCRTMAQAYQPVLDQYAKTDPGAVKVVIKDWPWNSDCNFKGAIVGHEAACDAAVAVRLARDRGKEEPMVEWIFANQEKLVELGRSGQRAQASQLIRDKVAEMLGVKDFDREYSAKLTEIRRDVADGAALEVHSTPTYFINGVRIPERTNLPPEYFDLAIRTEMKKSGGK